MSRPPLAIPLAAFGVRLADLEGACLELRCCGVAFIPVRLVAAPNATLGAVLTRMRCQKCRQPPRAVALVGQSNQDHAAKTGGCVGWRVEVAGSTA